MESQMTARRNSSEKRPTRKHIRIVSTLRYLFPALRNAKDEAGYIQHRDATCTEKRVKSESASRDGHHVSLQRSRPSLKLNQKEKAKTEIAF